MSRESIDTRTVIMREMRSIGQAFLECKVPRPTGCDWILFKHARIAKAMRLAWLDGHRGAEYLVATKNELAGMEWHDGNIVDSGRSALNQIGGPRYLTMCLDAASMESVPWLQ